MTMLSLRSVELMSKPKPIVPKRVPTCTCRWCGKQVRVRPVGGDWLNDVWAYCHGYSNGSYCTGSYREVKLEDVIWPKEPK